MEKSFDIFPFGSPTFVHMKYKYVFQRQCQLLEIVIISNVGFTTYRMYIKVNV